MVIIWLCANGTSNVRLVCKTTAKRQPSNTISQGSLLIPEVRTSRLFRKVPSPFLCRAPFISVPSLNEPFKSETQLWIMPPETILPTSFRLKKSKRHTNPAKEGARIRLPVLAGLSGNLSSILLNLQWGGFVTNARLALIRSVSDRGIRKFHLLI